MTVKISDQYRIKLQKQTMGRDLLITITGGVAHIGALATAWIADDGVTRFERIDLPEHKEGDLCEEIAKRFAEASRSTVTVVMGIHYDAASRQTIDGIIQEVRQLVKEELRDMER